MSESILTSIKKNLNVPADYTVFDQDIIMYINSAFSTLSEVGLGPEGGFSIENATAEWVDFLGADSKQYNDVKTYVQLRARMLFDPPATSFHLQAMERQLEEHIWRISVKREDVAWVDPNGVDPVEEDNPIIDGGSP